MTISRFSAGASLAALCLTLAACGGGGVNSTPTPTPGTGGGAPTPTPGTGGGTPTPSTGVNDDLLAPLVSESFNNNAAGGTATFNKNGSQGSNSASASSATISYDASSQRYTISNQGRSQAFGAADKDASQSNSLIDVYVKKNGKTVDTLTLTRSGTSGPLRYKYVGAGFWQRTTDGANTITGSMDAFTYGVKTADSAVPRSGQGNFTTDILGVIVSPYNLVSFAGDGVMKVRFDNGAIDLNGNYATVDPSTGQANPETIYDGHATLSGSTNSFTGTLSIFPLTTSLEGRFYGPAAEEVGATFVGSEGGYSITGTLTGRRAGAGGGDGLLSIAGDQTFDQSTGAFHYRSLSTSNFGIVLDSTGKPAAVQSDFWSPRFTELVVNFAEGSYRLLQSNSPMIDFSSANRVSAESNASYTVYRKTTGSTVDELRVYNPGAANPTIALTYSSFGIWTTRASQSGTSNIETTKNYFAYGLITDPTIFPTTGTASYNGIILGSGKSITSEGNYYDVSGTFGANVNFSTLAITGSLSPTIRNVATSQLLALPSSWTFNGQIAASSSSFGMGTPSLGAGSEGINMAGHFYGPTANEMAGDFFGQLANPGNPSEWIMVTGVGVAK
ncbi:MAG TPA: transferrin-binding protein-like solute binding protein [Sphingomonadaceae bacterium]|nr:transferrin-binding protein-like solute binding protein [Sphingomonadaceae bacterium]